MGNLLKGEALYLVSTNKLRKNNQKPIKINKKMKKISKIGKIKANIKSKKNLENLPTQGINNNKVINNNFNINLIKINVKKTKKINLISLNHNLNNYTFEEAIRNDRRALCEIFFIFLLSKQEAFHAFLYKSPLESFPLRVCLLIFILSSDLFLNAFLYLDDKISKKYRYLKNLFLFTFNNNISIILLSTLIVLVLINFFTNLSNSINNIRDIFKNEEQKIKKDKKYKVTEKRKKEIFTERKGKKIKTI